METIIKPSLKINKIYHTIEIHTSVDTPTEAVRYNASIWCHYIEWALKIRLENLNQVKNGFTWVKCFTQGCHSMAKYDI